MSCPFDAILKVPVAPFRMVTIEARDPFMAFWAAYSVNENILKRTKSPKKSATIDTNWEMAISLLSHKDLLAPAAGVYLHIQISSCKALSDPSFMSFLETFAKHPEATALLCIPKPTPSQAKSKAYQALKKHSQCIAIPAPTAKTLPLWLQATIKHYQLPIPQASIAHLSRAQHAPIRLWQLILQVRTASPSSPITSQNLASYLLTSPGETSVFSLIQAVFNGDIAHTQHLFSEEKTLDYYQKIYWLLVKQLRQITRHRELYAKSNQPLTTFLNTLGLWQAQKNTYKRLFKLPLPKLHAHVLAFFEAEWVLKGFISEPFSHCIKQLCLALCKEIHRAT